MQKLFGFTLAEVLVTLGIIGIVAALTLPTLLTNINDNAIEKQILKFYTQMDRAVKMYMNDNGYERLSNTVFSTSQAETFIKTYFNINNVSEYKKMTDFLPEKYLSIENSTLSTKGNIFPANSTGFTKVYQLSDGTVFAIQNTSPYYVYFDVNGKKGPNKLGKDMMVFGIFKDGTIEDCGVDWNSVKNKDYNAIKTVHDSAFKKCKAGTTAYGCFGHFKDNGFKFDY